MLSILVCFFFGKKIKYTFREKIKLKLFFVKLIVSFGLIFVRIQPLLV